MADPTLPPFDPGVVPSSGYATNSLASASTSAATPEPLLFAGWGPSSHADPTSDEGSVRHAATGRERVMLTPSQFLHAFDKFDREDFLKFRNLFIAAGLVTPTNADPITVRNTYASLLGQVADMTGAGAHISPMGYIKNLIRMNGLDPSKVTADENYGIKPEDQPFTGKKTTTQRNVTDISEGEAWSTLQNNLSQLLGRDPSDQETRDFVYRMNALAASNPTISKTVTRYKNGEAVASTTHTDPGLTSADVAQEAYQQAQNDPNYAEYQAAATYFNAAMSALGPIGG